MPLYGILIPSPSYTVGPLGRSGAGIAERVEGGRTDAGAKELTLILVVLV